MNQRSLTDILGMMIAGGRIEWLPARTPWPMHLALRELDTESGRRGLRWAVGIRIETQPSPEVGLAVRGGDEAFRALVRGGLLIPTGAVLAAGLLVHNAELVRYRRLLMTLEPDAAAMIQTAGSRWAALASTIANHRDAAGPSSAATVVSAAV
jgi:hypothetical protein